MSKCKIAIIVEVKKREMPFMSILQEVLKHKGYVVKLIPFRSMCAWRLLSFRPNIVLVNGLRTEDPYFIKQVYLPKKLFKAKIACYYSEQVGYYNESIAKTYNNKTILENVDYHIAWGPHFVRDLMELGVPREKLWFIGSVQYDIDKFLKKSYDTVKRELAEQYNIPYDRNWILYADNIIEAYQEKDLYTVRRRDTFNMIETVAKKNKESLVIFRHHPDAPEEEIKMAQRHFAKYTNVFVIPTGHIFDWTCAISALIIWVSTSSLQTFFMGKPVFGFVTSDGKDPEKYWHKDIFPTYGDSIKLSEAIESALDGATNEEDSQFDTRRKDFVKDWYFKKDGYAFERLCYLIDIINKGSYYPLRGGLKYSYSRIGSILYFELQAWVGDIVKGRSNNKNVFRSDIQNELKKYDVTKFSDKTFDIKESKEGFYLV